MDYFEYVIVKCEGFDAFNDDVDHTACPYKFGTDEYEAWHSGWCAGWDALRRYQWELAA